MGEQEIINTTVAYVKQELQNAEGGHDWFHIERVWHSSIAIAKHENVNLLVVQLGALLHDIADSKFHDGNEEVGPAKASAFLQSMGMDETTITHVIAIIRSISFKGGNFNAAFKSKELDVVQDADRLDALGAIGIARAFNYGGHKGRELFNPAIAPNLNMSKEEYKNSSTPTLNHFYEKLLLLKDRMNTETGKQLAAQRHLFMEQYLIQFYAEWNGIEENSTR